MSAGRNASTLLFSLVGTIALSMLFVAFISIPFFAKYGYAPDFGWQTRHAQVAGECDRALTTRGFPLTTKRPVNDPSGCLDSTNPLASALNVAVCFALAGIISVGAVEGLKDRL